MAVKRAAISASDSGDNTIVAASSGKAFRVLAYVLVADDAVAVKWKDGASTDTSGDMSLAANGGVAAPYNPDGHVATSVGNALVLNLSGAVAVNGHLTYEELG